MSAVQDNRLQYITVTECSPRYVTDDVSDMCEKTVKYSNVHYDANLQWSHTPNGLSGTNTKSTTDRRKRKSHKRQKCSR